MSIKLVVLKSGETLISDVKELISEEKEAVAYILTNPHKVAVRTEVLLTEESVIDDDRREVRVSLSPWIMLTEDDKFTVPLEWVVTVCEPLKTITEMYKEKTNG